MTSSALVEETKKKTVGNNFLNKKNPLTSPFARSLLRANGDADTMPIRIEYRSSTRPETERNGKEGFRVRQLCVISLCGDEKWANHRRPCRCGDEILTHSGLRRLPRRRARLAEGP